MALAIGGVLAWLAIAGEPPGGAIPDTQVMITPDPQRVAGEAQRVADEARPAGDALERGGGEAEQLARLGGHETETTEHTEPPAATEPHAEPAAADAEHTEPAGEPADGALESPATASEDGHGEPAAQGETGGAGEADPERQRQSGEPAAPALRLAAVDPALMQETSRGPLPIVGPDGRAPWQVYARPVGDIGDKPRIAILIMGLGLSNAALEKAFDLPGVVTLSFSPYAPGLEALAARARARGHEVLLDVPMEPLSYPADDPGPHTLLTSLNPTDNVARLEWLLGRFAGYVGVINHMGSQFTVSPDALRPVLATLNERGLMFVDSRSARNSVAAVLASEISLPRAINDRFVDHEANAAAIDRAFEELATIARRRGAALAVARPFPVTLERIASWVFALDERGIAVVPVTAVVNLQADR